VVTCIRYADDTMSNYSMGVQDFCKVCQMAVRRISCTSSRRKWRRTACCCVNTSPATSRYADSL